MYQNSNTGRGTDQAPSAALPEDADKITSRKIYVLALLMLISAFNYFDRSLLGLLAPMIRADIHITDIEYGLISGFAFVLFYALMGVPIAAYSDRTSARKVISIGFTVWSFMTLLTGAVTNAWQLAATRFLMGAGEACAVAPSNAMITSMFGARWRTRALAIFVASSSISSIVFFPLGGLLGARYGWRMVFVIAGLAGLAVAVLFALTVKDPPRPARADQAGEAQGTLFDFSFVRGPFLLILCSSAMAGAHLYAGLAWTAIFLDRVHGLGVAEISVVLGPYRGVLSAFGVLMAGYLTDRLSRRNVKWRIWLPALTCLILFPAQVMFLAGESRWVWMLGLGLEAVFMLGHAAPIYSVAMLIAGPRRRAVAVSLMLLSSSLVGTSLGPLLVGYLNDRVFASIGPDAIRYSMLVIAVFPAGSALMLTLAGRLLDPEILRIDNRKTQEASFGEGTPRTAH